eukprot:1183013-Prorocentrum_minimum.AAC.1
MYAWRRVSLSPRRDLNLGNLFIRNGNLYIGDFGYAMALEEGEVATGMYSPTAASPLMGTTMGSLYSAPELGALTGYDHSVGAPVDTNQEPTHQPRT